MHYVIVKTCKLNQELFAVVCNGKLLTTRHSEAGARTAVMEDAKQTQYSLEMLDLT